MNYSSQLTELQKKDWAAARILHTNNIPAVLAGPPTAAFYGSNVIWMQVIVLISDPSFEDASRVLEANGYQDQSVDERDYELLQPPVSEPDGKRPVKWRFLAPKPSGWGVILAPASHWHFKVTDDTTIVVDGIRFPKLNSYLHGEPSLTISAVSYKPFIAALISILCQRCQSSIPAGYYQLQALSAWAPQQKYPNSLLCLSPADQFFLDYFFKFRRRANLKKIVELWVRLNQGILTIEEAEVLVPVERRPRHERWEIPMLSIKVGGDGG